MIEIPKGFDHGIVMMPEQWRPIVGFENMYLVSDFGRVKSIKHIKSKEDIILRAGLGGNGYKTVPICDGVKQRSLAVHRTVALSFVTPVEGKDFVNHKDGIKTNNGSYNLEWCTKSENGKHAYSSGLRTSLKGERRPTSKLKEKDIPHIRELIKNGMSIKYISSIYNVGQTVIYNIKNNKNWSHVL